MLMLGEAWVMDMLPRLADFEVLRELVEPQPAASAAPVSDNQIAISVHASLLPRRRLRTNRSVGVRVKPACRGLS
jgi:hypothetical protein